MRRSRFVMALILQYKLIVVAALKIADCNHSLKWRFRITFMTINICPFDQEFQVFHGIKFTPAQPAIDNQRDRTHPVYQRKTAKPDFSWCIDTNHKPHAITSQHSTPIGMKIRWDQPRIGRIWNKHSIWRHIFLNSSATTKTCTRQNFSFIFVFVYIDKNDNREETNQWSQFQSDGIIKLTPHVPFQLSFPRMRMKK